MLGKFKKNEQNTKPEIVVKQTGVDDVIKPAEEERGIDWTKLQKKTEPRVPTEEKELDEKSPSVEIEQQPKKTNAVPKETESVEKTNQEPFEINDSRYDCPNDAFVEKPFVKYENLDKNKSFGTENQQDGEKENEDKKNIVDEVSNNKDIERSENNSKEEIMEQPKEKTQKQNIEDELIEEKETDMDTSDLNEEEQQNLERELAVLKKLSKNAKKASRGRLFSKMISKFFALIIWIAGLSLFVLSCSNLYQQATNKYIGFFGFGEAVVASNSMEPKLMIDDLILYKEVPISEITIGDIVVYQKQSAENTVLVVHEVIQIGDGYATTKGINNAIADEPILVTAIIGKYIARIQQAGVFLDLMATPIAPIIIIAILVLIFILRIVFYYINKRKALKYISKESENRKAIDYFFEI